MSERWRRTTPTRAHKHLLYEISMRVTLMKCTHMRRVCLLRDIVPSDCICVVASAAAAPLLGTFRGIRGKIGGMQHVDSENECASGVIVVQAAWLNAGSDLGSGSLPRAPRLSALPAVPRHPVRALAHLITIPRAAAAGRALAASPEVRLLARRLRGAAGGRHAARAAAPPAEHRERLSNGRAAVGEVGEEARDVERGVRFEVSAAGHAGGCLRAVGSTLQERLGDAGVARSCGVHERREAGEFVEGRRDEVDFRAASQEDLGEAEVTGTAERGHTNAVDGVGGCGGICEYGQVSY